MEQSESSGEHFDRVFYPHYHEHRYCTAVRSIDTVRALHQTVVSLRSALDESRQEIEKLKKQIIVNSEIQEARPCVHPGIASQSIDYKTLGDKVSELEKIYYKSHPKPHEEAANDPSTCNAKEEVKDIESKLNSDAKRASNFSLVPHISISTQNINDTSTHATSGGGSANNQMASRIDVKIKVSSNINVDNNDSSTGTSERSSSPQPQSETDTKEDDEKSSQKDFPTKRENPKVEVEMYEDSNTNTFNVDAKNLKITVTSQDNINITRSSDKISIHQSSSEYLNLDIDDMSEGDNSVFTEGATTPIEQRLQQVEDVGSDNETAANEDGGLPRDEREEIEDIPEEVDDIELIFSSDENKDAIQEDLVSLSEYEPWQEEDETGAPLLTKFTTLTSEDRDREAYYEKKKALKAARNLKAKEKSLSVDSHHGGREKSLESTDSLSFDNPTAVDYKTSSLEKDSSIDKPISRDPSFDTFTKHVTGMGKKWTNVNVLIETDMSKVGIGDDHILEMGRRNTCPNPPLYRPLGNRSSFRTPLTTRYPRSLRNHCPLSVSKSLRSAESGAASKNGGVKCSSSAQTDISALPHQWRSETHLIGADYCLGGFTLPSKYNAPRISNRSGKNSLRLSEKTQEARRVLLSDINFTSMVPELSRSADHLCQQKINEETDEDADYFKGNLLKTPDYTRGITPSTSMVASPGVSQWTVNESTTQTEGFWHERGDSFDSSKSYSMNRSGNSMNVLSQHQRSRSVPSIRCVICQQNHQTLKPSESMHYAIRTVTFQEPSQIRGSLPDLRHDCTCPRRSGGGRLALYRMHESSGSTESLLEEADEFVRHCNDEQSDGFSKKSSRRCSEADIQRDFHPSKQALPFLPKSPKCLKPGQLAKVIAKSRCLIGKIRYVGPVASIDSDETYVGLHLPNAFGDSDGSFGGKKFFECENNFGVFVPFKKVIMAWNS